MHKKQVIQELHNKLNARLTQLKETRDGLIESRESEGGKSSAGDKYETGVEMIQQEMERNQAQIDQVERQKEALNRVSLTPNTLVSEGSLVVTDKASYFIGIPFGELKLETGNIYCISSASPIGELLLGKKEHDLVEFRDQKINIKNIF